jgi:Holliday junction resolvase RusA-like endonuclease
MINGRAVAQNYTPKSDPVNTFKAAIQFAFAQEARYQKESWPVHEGALAVTCVLYFPRPKRLIWKKRPMPRAPMATKPDVENAGKAVLDALTGLAWRDDAQVSYLAIEKAYCAGDEMPRVEVQIQTMDEFVPIEDEK